MNGFPVDMYDMCNVFMYNSKHRMVKFDGKNGWVNTNSVCARALISSKQRQSFQDNFVPVLYFQV